ncbi:hypothetical protein LTR36_009137 [Oleoguttula mirabilis]|uniref:SET domain-containing protein n=1 Tax=Oleoguttula mirabilis TaxID=1507867 RepID=A0AAV9J681_9PEZI|nr:hypothetical protein LTR36_009137 [Oleoguttula mirabilis]
MLWTAGPASSSILAAVMTDEKILMNIQRLVLTGNSEGLSIEGEQAKEHEVSGPLKAPRATESDMFELRMTNDKGYGLLTIDNIKRGTCIFEEAAVATLPHSLECSDVNAAVYISEGLQKLSAEQLSAYNSLYYDIGTVDPEIRAALGGHLKTFAIFQTNAVSLGHGSGQDSGLFLNYSRMNHSCTPNAYNSCKGPGAAASKKRRRRLFDIDQMFAYLATEDASEIRSAPLRQRAPNTTAGLLRVAEELASLCKEEGLVDRQLGNAYRECSKYSLKLNQLEKTMEYALEELDIQIACVGTDYRPGTDAGGWVAKLQALVDEKQEAARQAEEQRLQAEKVAAEKGAYNKGKKATKKDKRAIRGAAEKVAAVPEETELLLSKLDVDEITALVGKLKGEREAGEVKGIFKDELKRLLGAAQIKEGELTTLG